MLPAHKAPMTNRQRERKKPNNRQQVWVMGEIWHYDFLPNEPFPTVDSPKSTLPRPRHRYLLKYLNTFRYPHIPTIIQFEAFLGLYELVGEPYISMIGIEASLWTGRSKCRCLWIRGNLHLCLGRGSLIRGSLIRGMPDRRIHAVPRNFTMGVTSGEVNTFDPNSKHGQSIHNQLWVRIGNRLSLKPLPSLKIGPVCCASFCSNAGCGAMV